MRARLLVILALLFVVAGTAAADSRSWATIKGKVPADAIAVVGIDAAPLRSLASVQSLFAMAVSRDPATQPSLDAIKAGCGVDAMAALRDLTLVVGHDEQTLVVLALDGVDERTFLACFQAAVDQQDKGVAVTARKKGKITEYSRTGEKTKTFLAWLAPGVVAFADDSSDRKRLDRWLRGRGARGALASALGKVSVSAPAWFAFAKPMPVDQIKGTLEAMHGTVTLSGSTIDTKATLVMGSADQATQLTGMITQMVPVVSQQVAKQQPDLVSFIDSIKAVASAAEVTITASMAESTLTTLVQQAPGLIP